MLLALNIGNTHFSAGFMESSTIITYRHAVSALKSLLGFEYAITSAADKASIKLNNVNGAIISSVNPSLTSYLEGAIKKLFGFSPLIASAGMNMELDLSAYDTKLIGSDRIAVCEAAIVKYGTPAIVFDFGTATTVNVIDSSGKFLGGAILAGLSMSLEALSKGTAQLPLSKISAEAGLIGHNTSECLVAGAVFGNAAMLDGMVKRIEIYLNSKANVLITGGNAGIIVKNCYSKVIYEPELLLEGLYYLYQRA